MSNHNIPRTFSNEWCKGFCTTCGTGCGEYSEEIFQLKKELEQLGADKASNDSDYLKLSVEVSGLTNKLKLAKDALEYILMLTDAADFDFGSEIIVKEALKKLRGES